jgi:hypothetical protein
MHVTGVLVLRNERPQKAGTVTDLIGKYGWEGHPHPSRSPDMSPPNSDVFSEVEGS